MVVFGSHLRARGGIESADCRSADRISASGRNMGDEKKHGEVSSPTQVRYDIVIFIGPVFIISTLPFLPQGACHFKKVADKQTVVHFFDSIINCNGARFVTYMHLGVTNLHWAGRIMPTFAYCGVCQNAGDAPTSTYG